MKEIYVGGTDGHYHIYVHPRMIIETKDAKIDEQKILYA